MYSMRTISKSTEMRKQLIISCVVAIFPDNLRKNDEVEPSSIGEAKELGIEYNDDVLTIGEAEGTDPVLSIDSTTNTYVC
jgi:hypothetical protein